MTGIWQSIRTPSKRWLAQHVQGLLAIAGNADDDAGAAQHGQGDLAVDGVVLHEQDLRAAQAGLMDEQRLFALRRAGRVRRREAERLAAGVEKRRRRDRLDQQRADAEVSFRQALRALRRG